MASFSSNSNCCSRNGDWTFLQQKQNNQSLPLLHKDPFDRLLVAQSMTEKLTLLTADTQLAGYGEHVRIVR